MHADQPRANSEPKTNMPTASLGSLARSLKNEKPPPKNIIMPRNTKITPASCTRTVMSCWNITNDTLPSEVRAMPSATNVSEKPEKNARVASVTLFLPLAVQAKNAGSRATVHGAMKLRMPPRNATRKVTFRKVDSAKEML